MTKVVSLANEFPNIQIVLDHAGLPMERSKEYFEFWRQGILAASKAENIYIKIAVYDIRGAVVAILENSFKTSGYYTVQWNAAGFASGVYFIQTEVGSEINNQKIMLVK